MKPDNPAGTRSRVPSLCKGCLILLLVAILYESARIATSDAFEPDKSHHIAAAVSLLDGRGLTYRSFNDTDVASPIDAPLCAWPPLYSLVFAALLPLVGDLWLTSVLVDVLTCVLFLSSWFLILEMLHPLVGKATRLLFWVYVAAVTSTLELIFGAERLAVAFLVAGVALSLASLHGRHRYLCGIAAGACAALAAASRYPFWPLIFVPAFGIAAAALVANRRERFVAAVLCAATAAAGLAILAIFLNSTAGVILGNDDYVFSGLYGEHLLRMSPFPADAARVPAVWAVARHQLPVLTIINGSFLSAAASALILILALAPVYCFLKACKPPAESSPERGRVLAFIVMGILTTLLTVGTLSYLSVRTSPLTFAGHFDWLEEYWTPVQQKRYFVPVFAFFVAGSACSVAYLIRRTATTRTGRLAKVALVVLVSGWILVAATASAKPLTIWATNYRGLRTKAADVRRDVRRVYEHVREHVEAGQPVLLVFEEEYRKIETMERTLWSARMAGACPVPLKAVRDLQALSNRSAVILVAIGEKDPNNVLDELKVFVKRHPEFREVISLRDGQLLQAVFPKE